MAFYVRDLMVAVAPAAQNSTDCVMSCVFGSGCVCSRCSQSGAALDHAEPGAPAELAELLARLSAALPAG